MRTAIELTSDGIRYCRHDQGRVIDFDRIALPAGSDPLAALASAPLPRPLGEVRIALTHSDLLLRCMIQPPAPRDRLDRMIRFELQGLDLEGGGIMAAWHVPQVGGSGDMRVLCLVGKRGLVDQIQRAVSAHGGRLSGITVSGVGLYHGWAGSGADSAGRIALVDVGAEHVHIALVQDGELLFTRSQSPGLGRLVADVAELRSIRHEDAAELVARLGERAPSDLREIVERHAVGAATQITNTLRFAKAQLQLAEFPLEKVYLAGAAARIPSFVATLGKRLEVPVRLVNPFAGKVYGGDAEQLDRESQLPSPWACVLGLAASDSLDLDLMDQARAERKAFWATSGALRVGAAVAVALMLLAVAVTELRALAQSGAAQRLDPLLATGSDQVAELRELERQVVALRERTAFLAEERAAGRAAIELLNVVSALQDPTTQPVYVRSFRLDTVGPGRLSAQLEGFSEDAQQRSKSVVLNQFREQLQDRYPLITRISDMPVQVEAQRQFFRWILDLDVTSGGA